MTSKQLKYYSSFLLKKNRNEEHKFLVEGIKLILEALNFNYDCEIILTTNTFFKESQEDFTGFQKKKIPYEILKPLEFNKLVDTKSPQGVVAVFKMKNVYNSLFEEPMILALENISDPGNMGTILRNCDWFGIKNILLSPGCAEIYNPKVIRASAGSVFHLNIVEEKNFYEMLSTKKEDGYKILCADLEGENIYNFKNYDKTVIALANEANGPTKELINICDFKVTIPKKGNAESLNVASASAVLLSELTK
jgi:TrmH family RNA methyltransferase